MKKIKLSIIFIIFVLTASSVESFALPPGDIVIADSNTAVTDTYSGKVKGFIRNKTYIFKGIPYGKAERFMAPKKPEPWKGVRSCLAWGPVCPQSTKFMPRLDEIQFLLQQNKGYMDEDCLRLNIWTPKINDNKKRPVMVWIHGGGYLFGSSQDLDIYDGESLSKKGDIVVVSVNHRLNVLGFADLSSFGDKFKDSSNAGIMDLVQALKWINKNIHNFGGDPQNITIFGQSGGGGKVGTLLCAPDAKGLFHKAIIQSGGNPKFQDKKLTGKIGKEIVKELGLTPENIDKINKIPYSELEAASTRAVENIRKELIKKGKPPKGHGFGLSPTLDGKFLPYKPDHPKSLALSENVPLLIGSLKTEVLNSLWSNQPLKDRTYESVIEFIKNKYGEKAQEYISAVKKAYPDFKDPTDLIDVDIMFREASVKHADYKSNKSKAPVFMYLFTWESPILDGKYKSMHCMDLPFVFNNIRRSQTLTGGGENALVLAHKISLAWINFAYSGNPNHDGLPYWPEYTKKNGATMFFDNTCSVKNKHDRDLLDLTQGTETLW